MSGEGCLASRPDGAPSEHATPEVRPHVVGKLGADGVWRVLLLVPMSSSSAAVGRQNAGAAMIERELTVDEAEKLAWGLLDYAKLVRDRIGLVPR